MSKSSRKSASRGLFMLPQPESLQSPPQSMYWVDESGRMWYSGGTKGTKVNRRKSARIDNEENAQPSQGGDAVSTTRSVLSDKDRNVTSKPAATKRLCDQFECATTVNEAVDSALTSDTGALVLHESAVSDESSLFTRYCAPALTFLKENKTTIVCILTFIAAVVSIETCVQRYGLEHVLRSKPMEQAFIPNFENRPLLTIASYALGKLPNSYDITVRVGESERASYKHTVIGTIMGQRGSHDNIGEAVTTTRQQAAYVTFTITGLVRDQYSFSLVSWDCYGKKHTAQHMFQWNHRTPIVHGVPALEMAVRTHSEPNN